MSNKVLADDPLLIACHAVLREVGGFPISAERLLEARPLIAEMVEAIRTLDEADVSDVEPATTYKVSQ